MMTDELSVRQFIEKLNDYPQEAIVVVEGMDQEYWPARPGLGNADRQSNGRLDIVWPDAGYHGSGEAVKVVVVR